MNPGEPPPVRTEVLLVSHTHWDREWYRTFEAFRAHLVDTVDRVLDQLDEDPGWCFLLDGQAVVVEDYLAVRPDRRQRLAAAVASGRLAVGPWYVQPDSLLPSGESHVRNLLEGRRVAESLGRCSAVAYCPDSFGHPAQFPQLFDGFGLGPFVYWRGNGDEIDELGPVYRWVAPDGSAVAAYALLRGYFCAAGLPEDPGAAADALAGIVADLDRCPGVPVLLMNGVDHMYPQPHTAEVAAALAARTGAGVRRGLLDDLRPVLDPDGLPPFSGELLGGRLANLLPGVWSSRMGLKVANRCAERSLVGWAEPWAALGAALGLADEAPSLRAARRALLANQAHDSIGGCSKDEVHRQMRGRFATATELADETTARVLQRVAGLGPDRHTAWDTALDVAVFNPSPHPRTDVVRVPLDGFPLYRITYADVGTHPLALAARTVAGYEVDGRPARVVASTDPGRVRMEEDCPALDLEFVVDDVPALGWRRVRLTPSAAHHERVDDGDAIANGTGTAVAVAADGTLSVTAGGRTFSGLGAVEDVGDRGDTYDFDPVDADPGAVLRAVDVERRRHPSGIERLLVTRTFDVPERVDPDRRRRSARTVALVVRTEVRVAPGVDRVDLRVEVDNTACDHRLRLLFPTGWPCGRFHSATTFDVATRTTAPAVDAGWWHPAPTTFPHQGWVSANGLTVAAHGLPEAEVTADGTIAVTLLRAVGWLSHVELGRRPIPAGPTLPAPDAQCPGPCRADLTIRLEPDDVAADPGSMAARASGDELGLRAVPAGPTPLFPEGRDLFHLGPPSLVLSALKPAEDGNGAILRVLNPSDEPVAAVLDTSLEVAEAQSVRLDESPDDGTVERRDGRVRFAVGPHALRSLRLRFGSGA